MTKLVVEGYPKLMNAPLQKQRPGRQVPLGWALVFIFLAVGLTLMATQVGMALQERWTRWMGGTSKIAGITSEARHVTKVIDGDTVIIDGGEHVRLLGIDADERGRRCYDVATKALEALVTDKDVTLVAEKEDRDKFDRLLRWIFVGEVNANEQLVRQGVAVARFYGESQYREAVVGAERDARTSHRGCKWQ